MAPVCVALRASRPASVSSSVLLPQPDGPMMASSWPGSASPDTSFSTSRDAPFVSLTVTVSCSQVSVASTWCSWSRTVACGCSICDRV